MILVDTSVWIDHLRMSDLALLENLRSGQVLMHTMVVGEVACGNLPRRAETIRRMRSLPRIKELTHQLVLSHIESRSLNGRGIGFIDAHLICSVLEDGKTLLWTRDRRLKRVAEDLGVAFSENPMRGR
jgi:predicted nucleic acid-binding protein